MIQLLPRNQLKWSFEGLLGNYKVTTLDEFWIGILALEAVLITGVLSLRVLDAIDRTVRKSRSLNRSYIAHQ